MSDESIRFEDAMAAQHAELEADRNLWKKLAHDGGVLVAALRTRIGELEAIITGLNTEIRLRGERIAKLEGALRRGRQIRIGLPGDTQTVRQTDFHAYMRDIDAVLGEQP